MARAMYSLKILFSSLDSLSHSRFHPLQTTSELAACPLLLLHRWLLLQVVLASLLDAASVHLLQVGVRVRTCAVLLVTLACSTARRTKPAAPNVVFSNGSPSGFLRTVHVQTFFISRSLFFAFLVPAVVLDLLVTAVT